MPTTEELLLAIQSAVESIQEVSDKLDTMVEDDGPVWRFTQNALEMANPNTALDTDGDPLASAAPASLLPHEQLLTWEEFARFSCMDGRAFGVVTGNERCDFTLNSCMRRHLSAMLSQFQGVAEYELKYTLTPQFHYDDIAWDGRKRVQLSRLGVSAVNVRQVVTPFEDEYPVSPYIAEGLDVTLSGGYYIVTIPRVVLDNPANAIIRNSSTGSVIPHNVEASTYPRRTVDNWEIAIDAQTDPGTVDVQHAKYIAVTVTTADLDCDTGEIIAFRPGTEYDVVEFAKSPTVDGLETTYWFYAWSLVDSDFMDDDEINLLDGEFYKLIENIQFACVTTAAASTIYVEDCGECTTCEDTPVITASLLFGADGIVELDWDEDSLNSMVCKPKKLRIYYKTDPAVLNINSDYIKEGLSYLIAASLPTSSCGCTIEKGFIADAQKPYTDIRINPVTGVTYAPLKYGNLHGHLVFAEHMQKAQRVYRLRRI